MFGKRRCSSVWAVALLATLVAAGPAPTPTPPHHLTKRSFLDIQCKGVYNKSLFAKVDRICEDCYNLYREHQLIVQCRRDCYSTPYFKGCLESLLLSEEEEKINQIVEFLGKKK